MECTNQSGMIKEGNRAKSCKYGTIIGGTGVGLQPMFH